MMEEKKKEVKVNIDAAGKNLPSVGTTRRGQSPSDAKLDRKPSVSRADEDSDVE